VLELNKNQKRLPIGGHHFRDHSVTFRGETLDEVVKKLTSFRASNNIPAGNPEQEVLFFYAKNWPYMVKRSENEEQQAIDNDYVAWRDSVYKLWSKQPPKFIPQLEAIERWNVCETCPNLVKIDWPTSPEMTELLHRTFLLSRGLQTPSFLGYCARHSTDLRSVVYVESPTSLSSKKDGQQPEKCWIL